jgi:hypothetical protein
LNQSPTSSDTVQPLYLWPKGADLALIKSAVAAANLPFKVKPFWFEPGKHERCIALEADFPYVMAEHVYPKSEKTAAMAVEWFFWMRELPVAKSPIEKLKAIFGDDVAEVWDDTGGPDTSGGWPA